MGREVLSDGPSIRSQMDIAIGPARDEHIPRLVEIYSGQELHGREDQARWYVQCHFDYNHIVVATVDGKVQGACFWRIEGEKVYGTGWIDDLFVERDYRSLGLGQMLVKRAISDLREHFSSDSLVLRKIFLTTHATNKAARTVYSRAGFVECATVNGMYEDGVDTLIYGLDAREHSDR